MIFAFVLLLSLALAQEDSCRLRHPSAKLCLSCEAGSIINVSGGCTAHSIPGCAIYAQEGACFKCAAGYTLREGECVRDSSGCVRYGENGECQECSFGTLLRNQTCHGQLFCA